MHWHGVTLTLLPFVLLALFWFAVVLAAIALIVRFALGRPTRPQGHQSEVAEDLLKQRYARGELSKEQYESMLSDLRR
jgi:putative membrane protein